jgi:hypothetical protein
VAGNRKSGAGGRGYAAVGVVAGNRKSDEGGRGGKRSWPVTGRGTRAAGVARQRGWEAVVAGNGK